MTTTTRYFLIGRTAEEGVYILEGTKDAVRKELGFFEGKENLLPAVPRNLYKMGEHDLVLIKGAVVAPGTSVPDPRSTAARPGDMWPEFRLPRVPTSPLFAPFIAFASALVEKTEGKVRAAVLPTPRRGVCAFTVHPVTRPSDSSVPFTLMDKGETVRVCGWKGTKGIALASDGDVLGFLREFGADPETRRTVRRLMLP
ncbi:hypothetical protein [Sorangium sp. So ce1151]|uniref:hypothetical protein n=1 Tax=Sorangium sp. So ce1151 TaxID=3133332 RepID=UPI003F63034D